MRPDVSVVMPTKNRRPHLRRALAAALGQEGVSVEVIVVDDGSDDGTAEDVLSLASIGVRLIRHEQSRGVSAARNAGIDAATGTWIAFLDDDDLWAPHKLVTQLRSVRGALGGSDVGTQAAEPQWICSASVLIDEHDDVVGWATPGRSTLGAADLLAADVVPAGGSGMVARADVLRDLGGFDTSMALYEDWDLWIRLATRYEPAVVDQPLVVRVSHPSSSSRDLRPMAQALRQFRRKHSTLIGSVGERSPIIQSLPQLSRALAQQDRRFLAATLLILAAGSRHESVLARAAWDVIRDPRTYLTRYDELRMNQVSPKMRLQAEGELANLLNQLHDTRSGAPSDE